MNKEKIKVLEDILKDEKITKENMMEVLKKSENIMPLLTEIFKDDDFVLKSELDEIKNANVLKLLNGFLKMNNIDVLDQKELAEIKEIEEEIGSLDEEKIEDEFCQMIEENEESSEIIYSEGLYVDIMRSYLRELDGFYVLSKEEEVNLFKEYNNGSREAYELLVKHNLRLVISVAKYYAKRNYRIPFLDLIQDGNLGLLKAVEEFDVNLGNKFSTYAIWWIRQSILRSYANEGRIIRLPVHLNEKLGKIRKFIRDYKIANGEEPTVEEILEGTGLTIDEYERIKKAGGMEPISLSTPVSEMEHGVESTVMDFIEDDQPTVEERVIDNSLKQEIEIALECLNPRERDIIEKRFGLTGRKPKTLEEVGQDYGVTRERIRQVEFKALRKLRNPRRCDRLRDYL